MIPNASDDDVPVHLEGRLLEREFLYSILPRGMLKVSSARFQCRCLYLRTISADFVGVGSPASGKGEKGVHRLLTPGRTLPVHPISL